MIKLLVVDDDKETRAILGHLVDATRRGVPTEVLFAETLAEARVITELEKPQITFLDLNLPDATVDEVLASIRSFQPPVIIVTGMSANEEREGQPEGRTLLAECMAAGAEDFLQKATDDFLQAQVRWMRVALQKYEPDATPSQT